MLLADDQLLFTRILETILSEDERFEVVGSAHDGVEVIDLAGSLSPDVVLMDINMPRLDGLAATRQILEQEEAVRVLMLTESDLPADAVRAERAGAAGYVAKTRIASDLRDAIVRVAG